MPAGLAFLNVKSWHPATYENQKKIWIAEQKAKEKEKREKEAAAQLAKEMETIRYEEMARTKGSNIKMLATDQEKHEKGRTSMSFLYAKPPGLAETEAAKDGSGADDEAVKEFYRKAAEKKKNSEDFSMYAKLSNLEKMTGKKRRTDDLTIEEQVERFPFLKDAPLEGGYAKDVKVKVQPFNRVLRLNTRCLRCGEWGHQTGDRECSLKDFNPHDAARQQREDPLTYMQQALPQEKQKIVLKLAALPREMAVKGKGGGGGGAAHDEVVLEDEGFGLGAAGPGDGDGAYDEVDEAFLATLSTKEKKLLLKRLKQQAAGGGVVGIGEGEGSGGGKRRKKEKRKRKKKDKKKRKSSSSGGGGSSSRKHKRRKRSASTDSSSSSSSSSSDGD